MVTGSMGEAQALSEPVRLQLHLEPSAPLEVSELTNMLASFARQYQVSQAETDPGGANDARLLVSAVSPGSIDIVFLPDGATALGMAATMFPVAAAANLEKLSKFLERLKKIIDFFSGEQNDATPPADVSIRDCDDATNIVRPIADHGGNQTINVFNGDNVTVNTLTLNARQASEVMRGAARAKQALQFPEAENHPGVSMVWSQLARDAAKTTGQKSPDRGLIEEIDRKPHAVLFTEEMSSLKREMIDDELNPYQRVYFVDVQVSRVAGKITAYRITGYHGKEDISPSSEQASLPSA